MSNASRGELTFANLQKFLLQIGFEKPDQVANSLAFQHPDSGTIVLLTIPADGKSIRPADLLSVWTRLEANGLADEDDVHQLKIGKLPLAS